jgi:hypothetical protein
VALPVRLVDDRAPDASDVADLSEQFMIHCRHPVTSSWYGRLSCGLEVLFAVETCG